MGNSIFLILLVWGGISLWNFVFPSSPDFPEKSYQSSSYSPFTSEPDLNSEDCSEPQNPYDYDSGHYAGFEWGESGNYCDGNSDSFIEGCEEYESQEEVYESCLNNQ